MKRIINYFWHNFKSSFKHKFGSYYEVIDGKRIHKQQYWNVWTNKLWIE